MYDVDGPRLQKVAGVENLWMDGRADKLVWRPKSKDENRKGKQEWIPLEASTIVSAVTEIDGFEGRMPDADSRKILCDAAFKKVLKLRKDPTSRKPLGPRTARKYEDDWIKHALPVLRRLAVRDVTVEHIVKISDNVKHGSYVKGGKTIPYSADSVRNVQTMLSSVFTSFASKPFSYRTTNPVRELGDYRVSNSDVREIDESEVFTEHELRRILEAEPNAMRKVMYELAHETGLRISEVVGLLWEHVEFERGRLRVSQQVAKEGFSAKNESTWFLPLKGKSSRVGYQARYVPLSGRAFALLKEWRQNPELRLHGLVFPTSRYTPVRADNLSDDFRRVIHSLRLGRELTFHSFRHTYASNLFAAGATMGDVQRVLGHSSEQTTRKIYVRLENADVWTERIASMGRG